MGPYIITWWSRVLKLETFKVLYFLKKRVPKSYQHRFPRPCSVLHTLSRIFLMLKKLKCWIFFCWETKMHWIFLSLGSSRKKNGLDSYLCRPRVNFTSPLVQTANMLWQGVWFNSVSPTKLHPTLTVYTTWGLHPTFVLNALCLCARKISINLLVQKLLVKWWWNWSLVVIVAVVCSSSCLRRTSDSPLSWISTICSCCCCCSCCLDCQDLQDPLTQTTFFQYCQTSFVCVCGMTRQKLVLN